MAAASAWRELPVEDFTLRPLNRFKSCAHALRFVAVPQRVLQRYRDQKKWLTIHQAAKLAGTSVRSLQRALAASGVDFSQLVDQTRCKRAVELLENTDVSLCTIATELGL